MRPAKTQTSLSIRPVWSECPLSASRNLGPLATHWAHSEDSDQTGRMPRLIWVFAGCTLILLVLSCCGLNVLSRSARHIPEQVTIRAVPQWSDDGGWRIIETDYWDALMWLDKRTNKQILNTSNVNTKGSIAKFRHVQVYSWDIQYTYLLRGHAAVCLACWLAYTTQSCSIHVDINPHKYLYLITFSANEWG